MVERRMAVRAQAWGRGFVARRWARARYRRRYMEEIETVAVTKISSVARMRKQFKRLMGRKREWWAATLMAGRYRQYRGFMRVRKQWTAKWKAMQDQVGGLD
jgi:hypothetical protein